MTNSLEGTKRTKAYWEASPSGDVSGPVSPRQSRKPAHTVPGNVIHCRDADNRKLHFAPSPCYIHWADTLRVHSILAWQISNDVRLCCLWCTIKGFIRTTNGHRRGNYFLLGYVSLCHLYTVRPFFSWAEIYSLIWNTLALWSINSIYVILIQFLLHVNDDELPT
jgi:hypothetical protein